MRFARLVRVAVVLCLVVSPSTPVLAHEFVHFAAGGHAHAHDTVVHAHGHSHDETSEAEGLPHDHAALQALHIEDATVPSVAGAALKSSGGAWGALPAADGSHSDIHSRVPARSASEIRAGPPASAPSSPRAPPLFLIA